MSHGHLRVYLGAAPGVGKTYRMLDEAVGAASAVLTLGSAWWNSWPAIN